MPNNLISLYQVTNSDAKNITPNPAKRKQLVNHLATCLKMLNSEANEREASQRNTFRDELLNYAIPKHYINGVGNIDIAIKHQDGAVGTIFEYKKPTNQSEMMQPNHLNVKGFQELIQYYLGQITGYYTNGKQGTKNTDRITGIITNGFSWYIINNDQLYKYFGKRKSLRKQYFKWYKNDKGSRSTPYLRDIIIAPIIKKALKYGIKIGHFDLANMVDSQMVLKHKYQNMFYRFLSVQNLLHEDIFTDSNELNKNFYSELLYLMGLKEHKKSKSKVITRDTSQDSTIVNNIVNRLEDNGTDLPSNKLNDIAIQLTVVWMNRFLFLKLLESQLYSFNNDDKSYKFLTNENLHNFNDVYDLFFDVLARRPKYRSHQLNAKYSKVPYLNSSLFEPSYLERKYLNINDLGNRPIDVYKHTSVKGYKKHRVKQVPILKYILDFLDSFNFSTSSIRKVHNTNDLINASVLGLIFEKINGYKDGAYFTAGWICQFMAHKAVISAVINKVNKVLKKHYSSLKAIKYVIGYSIMNSNDPMKLPKEINKAINSLKICDASVGSGHFLVSVLNELLAVKSYLGVLFDANGNQANFKCFVNNDELITKFNGERYYYHRDDKTHTIIQKTLFNEKRYLIENCLFGVDINPNSVEICHLRLWIELLKNAYYQSDANGNQHLTTMPNIDINIKAHNSLVHHFPLNSSNMLNKKQLSKYRSQVRRYKRSDDKNIENDARHKIGLLRANFNASIYTPDREKYFKKLHKIEKKVNSLGQGKLGETPTARKNRINAYNVARLDYHDELKKFHKSQEVDPFFKNENGMEWRSEFPEVLNNRGRFIGFDLIISNPPYVFARNNSFNSEEKKYYKDTYNLAKYQLNTYHMFIELAYDLLKKNGTLAYIVPNNILTISSNLALRKYLINNTRNLVLINSKDKLFQGASVDNAMVFFTKGRPNDITLIEMRHHDLRKIGKVPAKFFGDSDTEPIFSFSRVENQPLMPIYHKMSKCMRLGNIAEVDTGIKVYQIGKGHPKITKEVKDNRAFHSPTKLDDSYDKYLSGADVRRYSIDWGSKNPDEKWVKYGENVAEMRQPRYFIGPRILVRQIVNRHLQSIIASYISEDNVINDINSMIIRNSKINLLFILGVINSSIETVWFAMKFDKFQRKTFPQFKVKELRQFPIPSANPQQVNHLVDLVKSIMTAISKHNQDRAKHFNIAIDDYVMDLYGLSDDDKEKVRAFKL